MSSPALQAAQLRRHCFSLYGQWHEPVPDAIGFLLSLDGTPPPQPPKHQLITRSIGSAFAWSSDGILVTCAHVVRGIRGFIAEDHRGNQYAAKLVGFCTATDIAVLKIDASTQPSPRTTMPARQGDPVLTLGHPLMDELGFSTAVGIVAATQRFFPDAPPMPHIQLDMTIYPGNSGGPLFNHVGHLVGMVRGALIPEHDPVARIGLATDLSVLDLMVPRLLATGHGHLPPDLGVTLSKLRPPLAKAFNLQPFSGLLVDEVVADSLAEQSGLRVGDVLTAINGIPVNSLGSLQWAMLNSVGNPLKLAVYRDGLLVQLVQVDAVSTQALPRPRRYRPAFGLTLRGQRTGVRVLSVHPGSQAALSGLIGGEVLYSYQCPDRGEIVPLNRREQVLALANTFSGRSVAFLLRDSSGTVRQVGISF